MAIRYEMVHDHRVIPLDGRAPLAAAVRQYMGDARGRWEGDTLVVETTNFTDNTLGVGISGGGAPASTVLRIVERFTRVSREEIDWQATVTDPKMYTKPITVSLPIRNDNVPNQIFEYACHEGNRTMDVVLAGARARERKAAEEAAKAGNR